MSALPIYSLALGPDRAAGLHGHRGRHEADRHRRQHDRAGAVPADVPELVRRASPSPPSAIGALVPAAIMSIAAANLFTRNIYKEYLKKDATPRQEARVAKIASLVVKLGAVAAILFLNPQFSIDLQLIGGVIILQTLPSVALGLYTRWLHRGGLIAGWVAGMVAGLLDGLRHPEAQPRQDGGPGALRRVVVRAVASSGFDTKIGRSTPGSSRCWSTWSSPSSSPLILRAMKVADGVDGTAETDYTAEREDPTVRDLPDPLASAPPGRARGQGVRSADDASRAPCSARRRSTSTGVHGADRWRAPVG